MPFSSPSPRVVRFAPLVLPFFALAAGCSVADVREKLDVDFSAKGTALTHESFQKLSDATGGITYESKASTDMAGLVGVAMEANLPDVPDVDIVFCVDTTASMQDDIDAVKAKLGELVDALAAAHPDWQVGVATYRDRGDDYEAKTIQTLTRDKALAQAGVDALKAEGGGDYREHVYAGLDVALREQPWREGASRRILLIGDAPPHESYKDDPRNFTNVTALANEKSVQIHSIGVACDAACALLVSAIDGATGGEE